MKLGNPPVSVIIILPLQIILKFKTQNTVAKYRARMMKLFVRVFEIFKIIRIFELRLSGVIWKPLGLKITRNTIMWGLDFASG